MKIVRAKAPNGAIYRPIGGGRVHIAGKPYTPKPRGRAYAGAAVSRLTADWITSNTSADAEIWRDIRRLRDRSRDFERNNPYFNRFLGELETNVLGYRGIGLQMKIRNGKTERNPGEPDTYANDTIENKWWEWGQAKNCTVTGQDSWHQVQKLCLRAPARDGGVIIRKIRGWDNPFGFALQLLEIDHLDIDYTTALPNGNQVRMGVEVDKWSRPVAYYLLTSHPGDSFTRLPNGVYRERVPADEIIHPFIKNRIGQTVGVPIGAPIIQQLNMLNGYEEAELVAARTCAAKMGFFSSERGEEYDGEKDENGNTITEAEPGAFEDIGSRTFIPWDPTHPNGNYNEFRKGVLRGIAAGLGCSYNMLASDLEGVNYSSLRGGLLDEREMWMMLQTWMIENIIQPVFDAWLETAMLSGAINLPMSKFDKFNSPEWKGRRWAWVDPLKDVQAAKEAIAANLTSHKAVIAEQGGDRDEVFADRQEDETAAKAKGLVLLPEAQPKPAPAQPAPKEE